MEQPANKANIDPPLTRTYPRSAEEAANALNLDGIIMMGVKVRIAREDPRSSEAAAAAAAAQASALAAASLLPPDALATPVIVMDAGLQLAAQKAAEAKSASVNLAKSVAMAAAAAAAAARKRAAHESGVVGEAELDSAAAAAAAAAAREVADKV